MREVWDTDWLGSTKTLDTHVLALRDKLGSRGDHDAARRRLPLRGPMRRRLVAAIAGIAAVAVVVLRRPARRSCSPRSYRDEALLRLQRDTIAATRAIDLARPVAGPRRAAARPATRSPSTTPPGGALAGRGPADAPTRRRGHGAADRAPVEPRRRRPPRCRGPAGRRRARRAASSAPRARTRAAAASHAHGAWLTLALVRGGDHARLPWSPRWSSARRLVATARAPGRRGRPPGRRRLLGARAALRRCPRSTRWPPRSTRPPSALTSSSTASGRSAPTPPISCARRCRRCASSSRRPSCAATRRRSSRRRSTQVDRLQADHRHAARCRPRRAAPATARPISPGCSTSSSARWRGAAGRRRAPAARRRAPATAGASPVPAGVAREILDVLARQRPPPRRRGGDRARARAADALGDVRGRRRGRRLRRTPPKAPSPGAAAQADGTASACLGALAGPRRGRRARPRARRRRAGRAAPPPGRRDLDHRRLLAGCGRDGGHRVPEVLDAAGKVDVQPVRDVVGQRREDDLVVGAGPELLLDVVIGVGT